MSIQSIINRFKRSEQSSTHLYVVVQPSALFFSSSLHSELPRQVELNGQPWQQVLTDTLQGLTITHVKLDVVLHSSLYKTYQIDKPNVPEEELAQALPFLLKELISERISDVIIDSMYLSTNNKLQVYVVDKGLVSQLYRTLMALSIELERVLVEDEIWGHSAGELSHFLLLQRSQQGAFRVSAFINSQSAFQRTMRGITPPLTGVASSALQLDGIALELQRSIDYLSSQLRSAPLHTMMICCDEESQQEMVEALNQRLSVKTARLSEQAEWSGEILVRVCENLPHAEINLFPEELRPKKEYVTLTNIAIGWGFAAILLVVVAANLNYQQRDLTQQLAEHTRQQAAFKQQMTQLTEQLNQHKPSAAKEAAIARLQLEIDANQSALAAVEKFVQSQQVGYSSVLRSLATLGRNDISLQTIRIDGNGLDLTGLAQSPQAIPNWVNQFKHELSLVGRTFEQLKIGRNEQDIITFELKTQRESN